MGELRQINRRSGRRSPVLPPGKVLWAWLLCEAEIPHKPLPPLIPKIDHRPRQALLSSLRGGDAMQLFKLFCSTQAGRKAR